MNVAELKPLVQLSRLIIKRFLKLQPSDAFINICSSNVPLGTRFADSKKQSNRTKKLQWTLIAASGMCASGHSRARGTHIRISYYVEE